MSDEPDDDENWPRELGFLLERHPRATWPVASSATVSFWLELHDRLRRACDGLEVASNDYRAKQLTAAQLAVIAAPRLHGLFAAVFGHHRIEDVQYFPAFRRQEPRLTAGFNRLESEHAELTLDVDAARKALTELRGAAEHAADSGATLARAADRYIAASSNLCDRLRRHLRAEEDLVVPLLLEYVEH